MLKTPKIAFFTGSCVAIPAILSLREQGLLAGVVVTTPTTASPDFNELVNFLNQQQITGVQFNPQQPEQVIAVLDTWQANLGIIYTFSHIVPASLIQYFAGQLFNVHPAPLPDYPGPAPVYWQIRRGEQTTALTLHKVTDAVDGGDIGLTKNLSISPFATYTRVNNELARALPELVTEFLTLQQSGAVQWQQQQKANTQFYCRHIQHDDLLVDFRHQGSREIIDQVRAGNPLFAGAAVQFKAGSFQLLQASNVDRPVLKLSPGTVLSVDLQQGVLVKTKDGAISLDIVSTPDGVFSGYRFALEYKIDAGTVL